jgi:hypothetical protein
MMVVARMKHALAALAGLLVLSGALAATNPPSKAQQAKAGTLSLGGVVYLHRWSKNGQNEFTPESEKDLARWQDMVTIDVHDAVRNGEQLAALANAVLGNYQKYGKIVRADSKPATPQRPAEHLVVAILSNGALLEAVFARVVLVDGTGVVAVRSHRIYGKDAAGPMGEWLKTNAPSTAQTLMTWDRIPSPGALRQLPQSQ